MSRIGKQPISIPDGVTVSVAEGRVSVKGPRGELHRDFSGLNGIHIETDGKQVLVTRESDHRTHRSLHGLTRSLVANMVHGVTQGFEKVLELEGVGYRAEMKGKDLVVHGGFSHPIEYPAPEGIDISVGKVFNRGGTGRQQVTPIHIAGFDKEMVGQVAAEIRRIRPPEPYKGKGIRYRGEYIRKKAGKTGAATA